MRSDKVMMFVDQLAYINAEIKDCEIAMGDCGIDADKWGWRKKAFEDMRKKLIERTDEPIYAFHEAWIPNEFGEW